MTTKDIRKVAVMWERNNRALIKDNTKQDNFFLGFATACASFQGLIDGKFSDSIEAAKKESKTT